MCECTTLHPSLLEHPRKAEGTQPRTARAQRALLFEKEHTQEKKLKKKKEKEIQIKEKAEMNREKHSRIWHEGAPARSIPLKPTHICSVCTTAS